MLHLSEKGRGSVSHEALQRAIGWAEYLETHARRVYGSVSSSNVVAANLILNKILQRKLKSSFSPRDVYRPQWSGLTRREAVKEGLELLVDYDWIRPIIKKQGKSRTLYLVNPKTYSKPKKGTDNTDRKQPEGHLSVLSVPPKGISPNFDGFGKTDPTVKRESAPTTDNPDAPGSGENAETNLHPTDNTDRTPNPTTLSGLSVQSEADGESSPGTAEHDFGQTCPRGTDKTDTGTGPGLPGQDRVLGEEHHPTTDKTDIPLNLAAKREIEELQSKCLVRLETPQLGPKRGRLSSSIDPQNKNRGNCSKPPGEAATDGSRAISNSLEGKTDAAPLLLPEDDNAASDLDPDPSQRSPDQKAACPSVFDDESSWPGAQL